MKEHPPCREYLVTLRHRATGIERRHSVAAPNIAAAAQQAAALAAARCAVAVRVEVLE